MKSWTVYKHISPSGKVYVGISSNVKNRWAGNGYYYQLSETIFSRAIKKYGWPKWLLRVFLYVFWIQVLIDAWVILSFCCVEWFYYILKLSDMQLIFDNRTPTGTLHQFLLIYFIRAMCLLTAIKNFIKFNFFFWA